MNIIIKLIVIMLCLSAFSSSIYAQQAIEDKQIRTGARKALNFDVGEIQARYVLGEGIRFTVQAKQPFYLWIYSQHEQGDALLLAPNTQRHRYAANREHWLPGAGLAIVADKLGAHQLTLVASRKPLNLDFAELTSTQTTAGNYPATALEQAFVAQGADFSGASSKADTVIRRLSFEVIPPANHSDTNSTLIVPASDANAPMAFVRMNRTDYRSGEPFQLVYGATADGYMHILLHEPDGRLTPLLKKPVKIGRAYMEKGTVTEPLGQQDIIGIYTADEHLDMHYINKGILLDKSLPAGTAYHRFNVDSSTHNQ